MILIGACVFSGTALLTGMAHYKGTEKKLVRDGVSQSARRAALPLATRALASSTLGCLTVGALAAAVYSSLGGEHKGMTEVASWSAVVETAREGTSLVRREFRRRMAGGAEGAPDHGHDTSPREHETYNSSKNPP